MNKFKKLFSNDLIFLNVDYKTKEELVEDISKKLKEDNRVKDTFLKAITDREIEYPTGLPIEPIGVAIPHTDPEHVIEPCIVIIKPNNPIMFKEMGQGENDIPCKFIFMLVIKNNGEQVELLQNLISIFVNEENMNLLNNCKNEKEIYELIQTLI